MAIQKTKANGTVVTTAQDVVLIESAVMDGSDEADV